MKTAKFFIVGVFVFVTQLSNAQNKSDKIYNAFSNKEGVTNITFTKDITDAFNIDLGEDVEEKNLSGNLSQIKFLSYNPKKGDLSGSQFIKKAEALLPSQYKEYKGENNRDDNADIYLLGNNRKFKEFLIFVKSQGEDQLQFVVSFYGDFTLSNIDGLKKTRFDLSDNK